MTAKSGIEPSAEALLVVEALRLGGTSVALATNQQAYRADFMSSELGYTNIFDHLFYSCELGLAKPGPEYFQAILQTLNQPAERVLFIDDHETNVAAARAVGLHAQVYHLDSGAARMSCLLGEYGLL